MDIENQRMSRKVTNDIVCGLSMFGDTAEYHRTSIDDYNQIERQGDYSVTFSESIYDTVKGYQNPLFIRDFIDRRGNNCGLNLKFYVCYCVQRDEVPVDKFDVINDESSPGHHTIAFKENVILHDEVYDRRAPISYKHGISRDIVNLDWTPHCIRIAAFAKPLPLCLGVCDNVIRQRYP